MTLWRTFLLLLWCAVFVCAGVLIGEYTGLLDTSAISQAMGLLPVSLGTDTPRSAAAPSAAPAATPSVFALGPPPTLSPERCTPDQPRFVQGAAALKAAIGDDMGNATECERVIDAAGDTEQRTTTGLVYYRASTNAVAFTNGFDHWALAPRGVVHWTGDSVDPP